MGAVFMGGFFSGKCDAASSPSGCDAQAMTGRAAKAFDPRSVPRFMLLPRRLISVAGRHERPSIESPGIGGCASALARVGRAAAVVRLTPATVTLLFIAVPIQSKAAS